MCRPRVSARATSLHREAATPGCSGPTEATVGDSDTGEPERLSPMSGGADRPMPVDEADLSLALFVVSCRRLRPGR
jgi:hypothetical protein